MKKHKGFSLLEILVAFSILAVSLGILLKIFSSGVNTAVIAEEYIVATQIAESLMAKNGIEEPLVLGETSGVEAEKYRWQVSVENAPDLIEPDLIEKEESRVLLMEVEVSVEWGESNQNNRSVVLNTVKQGVSDAN